MKSVIIYSTQRCPYCWRAKALLDEKGVTYTEHRIDHNAELRQEMHERSKRRSVPQIFINDMHIGGCDELYALDNNDELDDLLEISP